MYKKTMIASGIAMAVAALPVVAEEEVSWADDIEISGELKNETAVFTKDGTTIGAATAHDNGDVMKSETSARLFINAPVGESSELHAELRPVRDGEAVDGMKGHENYTQQDWLRELYVDTAAGEEDEIALRIGKQQVVWGTADGMKLLDIINPTDYREMAQNSMDESRIPVWMINAETDLEDGSNIQLVISQPKENVFAGLDRDINTAVRDNGTSTAITFAAVMDSTDATTSAGHSQGHPFIMKGVDSITGKTNGFVSIVPDLGSIAQRFQNEFSKGGLGALQNATTTTVGWFATQSAATIDGAFGGTYTTIGGFADGTLTGGTPYDGTQILGGFAGAYDTNLIDAASKDTYRSTSDSTFEYMQNATFSTFDAMAGAKSQYVYNMPDDELDVAMRYKNSTDDGLNYSLNYSYNYDKNPIINLSWRNSSGGELTTTRTPVGAVGSRTVSLKLTDSSGQYGAYGDSGVSAGEATLRFEETVKRAHNIGGSFDTAIDTEDLGAVVLRGEALYQKDVYSPVMDLTALSIGDLPAALTMVKGDRFKYVLGADITVLKNMMVSAQFIQDRNLDYVDTTSTIYDHTLSQFTTDYATMHLTNGFNKAEKNKEFYSLFFSKPFGAEQQHRWNNIFMFEENGGKWNRFDVEYSFDDELIGTAEYNKYWGDANTQFGQLEASSNFQLGLKYLF